MSRLRLRMSRIQSIWTTNTNYLVWVPCQTGITGNEITDILATELLKHPPPSIKALSVHEISYFQKYWNTLSTARHFRNCERINKKNSKRGSWKYWNFLYKCPTFIRTGYESLGDFIMPYCRLYKWSLLCILPIKNQGSPLTSTIILRYRHTWK